MCKQNAHKYDEDQKRPTHIIDRSTQIINKIAFPSNEKKKCSIGMRAHLDVFNVENMW